MFCFVDAQEPLLLRMLNYLVASWAKIFAYFDTLSNNNNAAFEHVEERLEKRLSSWEGKLLSVLGRVFLINSDLCDMVHYMISSVPTTKRSSTKVELFRITILFGKETVKKNKILQIGRAHV